MGTMHKLKNVILAAVLAVVSALPALADTRKDNIDVIIALDKSISMEKKIGAVESWVNSFIIDQLLIPGDYLVVVAFYGKADVAISQTVNGDSDKAGLKESILKLKGDGRFTDIGNALDVIKAQVDSRESDGREKYVLLLTDGIQEAPPGSKYYSKNGKFNHAFLVNTKTIQNKGWKVMILGIGTDTAAKDLAKELSGSYKEIAKTITVDALTDKTGGFFGQITLREPVTVSPIAPDGGSGISLAFTVSGLRADANVVVSGISATIAGRAIPSLLSAPFSIPIKKGAVSGSTVIPVTFPSDLPTSSQVGTVAFAFSSAERFTPESVTVTVQAMTWLQRNLLLVIAGAAVLLILAAAALFLVWRLTKGKPLSFAVIVGDEPVDGGPVALREGRELFLLEKDKEFHLVPKKNARAFARFTVKDHKIVLTVLKQDRWPKLKEVPPDVKGKTFPIRTEDGRTLSLKVQSKERKR
jgi:Mg-chelatase subunit ChlD